MSVAQLASPNENTKPGSIIYQETIVCKNLTVSGQQTFSNVEVKNNLLVDGYTNSSSNQDNAGTVFFSTQYPVVNALPAGVGGGSATFSSSLQKAVISGVAGVNTAGSTVNGTTFTQLTTPFANPGISWSPDLALFTGIDGVGTAVYTSPTAVNGTWVLGTPLAGATFLINAVGPKWITAYQKFFVGTGGAVGQTMASSANGSLYALLPAARDMYDMAYSPELNRLVTVGNGGPMYSDDGKVFNNGSLANGMSSVCWSSFWKKFVATPRGGVGTNCFESFDGITWIIVANAFDAAVLALRSVIFINEFQCFIAQGDADIYISKDGILWRKRFGGVPAPTDIYGAFYISDWGMVISSGIGGNVLTSPRRYAL